MTLQELLLKFGVDVSAVGPGLDELNKKVKDATKEASSHYDGLAKLGQGLVTAGAGLTAGLTVPLVGFGAAAVAVSEQLNMAKLSFTTMLGSGEKAAAFLQDLQKFAASTPFEFPDLVDAAKRMKAMGFEANQVVPTLRSIGDAAAALGGGKAFIDGVTTALGQMQAKGKVSAEEMKQLAERGVPAWDMLAKAIGVSVPEAMKLAEKGAITAADAIPAILSGMNQRFGGQMEQASKTLTGVWSNFKDQATFILADFGNKLAPVLLSVLGAAMPVLEWARDAAGWFAQLPEPIQAGAMAFAAIVAAIGPLAMLAGGVISAITTLTTVAAPLAAALGVGTAALGGFALAIPLVLAALVALGVWIYDNWTQITAVVAQAWEGIGEIWRAAWGPLLPWLVAIWDAVKGATIGAWNAIAQFLGGIWEGIKNAAAVVWGGIVGVFKTFLEWAAKIPGVNKLINLDEAWKSAAKTSEEMKKAATSTQAVAKAATAAAPATNKFSAALGVTGKQAKSAAVHVDGLKDKAKLLWEQWRTLNSEWTKSAKEINAARATLAKLGGTVPEITLASSDLNASIQDIVSSAKIAGPTIDAAFAVIDESVRAAVKPVEDLDAAYRKLGVTSTASLATQATEAQKAYESIKNSGSASVRDIDAAWVAYETARINAARAAGEVIPAETEKALKLAKQKLEGSDATKPWSEWSKQVSTIVTDLGKKAGEILFDGEMSWGEKGKAMLDALGQTVTRSFVEPATKALMDFAAGAVSDLLGGKGFGGLIDRVKDLGETFSKVWDGITGATKNGIPGVSVPGTGGGSRPSVPSGGAGGGVLSSIGGVAGAVNLASGVISAVAGVFTAIGTFRLEGTMNAVEENTRYGMIHTLFILEEVNKYLGRLDDINNFFYGVFAPALSSLMSTAEHTRDLLVGSSAGVCTDIRSSLSAIRDAVVRDSGGGLMSSSAQSLAVRVPVYLDGRLIGEGVADYVEAARVRNLKFSAKVI